PQVVGLANGIMAQRGASTEGIELVAQRPSGPAVGYHAYADDVSEAGGVADRIAALVAAGVSPREVAVLYRTNSQSEALEEALATRGIGYLVRGGQRFFGRDEVRKAMLLLRGAAVSASTEPVGIQARSALESAGWTEEPPAARGAVRDRWESLQALAELADDWEAESVAATGEGATMRSFVEHLAERASAQHAPAVEGVTLSTLHAAKGLEWDAVFMVGMSEGLLPISLAETDEAVEEERRLLYVGVTRAREHLNLSFARSRKEGGKATRKRTRFLEKWWPDARPAQQQQRPARAAAHDLDVDDLRLFEALKAWRWAHAQADSKPAFTVLVDSSLISIARNRPQTLGELAKVHGVGATKLERYGLEVLEVVAAN
ncbi:MAG: ATP-dependent DNA helicase UvrD2, partial [Demequinaceae bacterium]|nr:ATP-dependent DNA helicase UvrD2 [Demequinaceae bacterium]